MARDFASVLGVSGRGNGYIENNEYVISWCVGHLVGLLYPEDYDAKLKNWKLEDLPFLPENYKYGVIESVKNQYGIINNLLHREDIDTVYWAGDSGKEGQTIEENIRMFGGVREGMKELRVWIDSQTDDEIRRGIKEARPMSEYERLGQSGIMRTIEDYALGINFSRVLSVKYGKVINSVKDKNAKDSYSALAVGRVMTCVLGMVVNREREIRNFVETPFYRVIGYFSNDKFPAQWRVNEKSQYYNSPILYKDNGFKNEEDANTFINSLTGKDAYIDSIEKSTQKKKAPPLFNLAELQASLAKIYKISPNDALNIAQNLYEKKLTTYPRTDARVLTTAVAGEIDKNLKGLMNFEPTKDFVKNILDNGLYKSVAKSSYTDDSKVTDHYAIIPTGQTSAYAGLSPIEKNVYELIVRRFLSIFYPPAEFMTVKMTINIDDELFYVSSKALKKKGYMEISGFSSKDDKEDKKTSKKKNAADQPKESEDEKEQTEDEEFDNFDKEKLLELASTLKKGDKIDVNSFGTKDGKTSPPKRYTSGTMILAMENAGNLIEDEELRAQIKNCGIGTSATRAGIIDKLVNKTGFINQNPKTLILSPEKLGEVVYEVVDLTVPSLLNPVMSASWEKGLEDIINGSVKYEEYRSKMEEYIRTETLGMINGDVSADLQKRMSELNDILNVNVSGVDTGLVCPDCGGKIITTPFGYGCNGYKKDDPDSCKFAVGNIAGVNLNLDDLKDLILEKKTKVIDGFVSKSKKKFKAVLVLNKNENGRSQIEFNFDNIGPDIVEGVSCPNCKGPIHKTSFGYGCGNYSKDNPDSCKFSVGKIAGVNLKTEDLKELINNGRTGVIDGFQSKSKKKFKASLILTKNEEGLYNVSFDFENVAPEVIDNVKCPSCGGNIIKTMYGYKCEHFDKNNEKGCNFSVGTLCGKNLNIKQLAELINDGKTGIIKGFKSKNGAKFDARIALSYDDNNSFNGIKFEFDDLTEVIEGIKCPMCGNSIIKNKFGYKCACYDKDKSDGCKFSLGKISGIILPTEEIIRLVNEGKTSKICGFTSKNGKSFDATLVLTKDESGKVSGFKFEF